MPRARFGGGVAGCPPSPTQSRERNVIPPPPFRQCPPNWSIRLAADYGADRWHSAIHGPSRPRVAPKTTGEASHSGRYSPVSDIVSAQTDRPEYSEHHCPNLSSPNDATPKLPYKAGKLEYMVSFLVIYSDALNQYIRSMLSDRTDPPDRVHHTPATNPQMRRQSPTGSLLSLPRHSHHRMDQHVQRHLTVLTVVFGQVPPMPAGTAHETYTIPRAKRVPWYG